MDDHLTIDAAMLYVSAVAAGFVSGVADGDDVAVVGGEGVDAVTRLSVGTAKEWPT